MVELQTKPKTRWRIVPIVVIAVATVVVVSLVFQRPVHEESPPGMSQEELADAIGAADFSTLIFTYKNNPTDLQKPLLEVEIPARVHEATELFLEDKITIEEVTSLIDQLNGLKGFQELSSQSREMVEKTEYSRKLFENGQNAVIRGDFAGALAFLSPLKEQDFDHFPGGSLLYQRALDGFYEERVASAGEKIRAYDFEGAKILASQLAAYFPDDWRVKNLVFSSTDVELYDDKIQHLFYHPLIAYPERAFDKKGNPTGEDNYMATVSEFLKTTQQLYDKGYILIDINSLYEAAFDDQGRTVSVTPKPLYLPKGKKPYILSVDDINYYDYMKKDGHVFKLVLNENGDVVTYSKNLNDEDYYASDNEIVPLLDQFVKDHPDASFNSAKGTLAVTGYSGILGYRTDEPDWEGYEQEVAGAKAVVARLKETGWSFASHSQGHRHTNEISLSLLKYDTDRWAREVLPLVGPTSIYVYPFGEGVAVTDPKFDYLKKSGFAMFCTVSSNSRVTFGDDFLLQGRRAVDGIALRDRRLYDLLDVPSIIDPIRPSYAKWSQWAKENQIIP